VELADNPAWTFGTMTVDFTEAGTYEYRAETFIGTLTLINSSGDDVTVALPQGLSLVNTGPDITVDDSLIFAISGANIIDGAKVRVNNVTQNIELDITTVSGGSGYSWSGTIGTGEDIEDGDEIEVRVAHYEKQPLTITRTASSAGLTFTETLAEDTVRTTYGLAESVVEDYTQFEADYPDIEINFEGTGDFDWSAEELYCWYKWLITTDFGIRTYFGALEPVDIGTLVIKTDVVDMYFDNENAGTSANEVTGITISRDDPIEPRPKKASTAGSISVNWSKVYAKVLTVSGASVITGDISQIPSTVWGADVSSYTGNSAGKKISDTAKDAKTAKLNTFELV
jgi:hypothetical protein